MSTHMDGDGKMIRGEHKRKLPSEPGVLRINLKPGQSFVCHKPGEPLDRVMITVTKTTNGSVQFNVEGASYEFWRKDIYDQKLMEMAKGASG